ncbi:hypothetical protein V493_03258 [Pseudogymnoascus sp. VKM F-4281 (FW-2241)]|nr:hypothetical protein V493_03258 [Pseudogymnoascus sp. VKM F-4281 (FW-2241)]
MHPNVPYPPLPADATPPLLAASEDLVFAGHAADDAVERELAVPEDAEAKEEDEEAAEEEQGKGGGEEAEPGGLDEEDGEGGFGFEVGAVGGLDFGHSGTGFWESYSDVPDIFALRVAVAMLNVPAVVHIELPSFVAHDLGAAIAVVQVMAELDHATGAGIVGSDVAAVVGDGLGAHGTAGAAHGLDR